MKPIVTVTNDGVHCSLFRHLREIFGRAAGSTKVLRREYFGDVERESQDLRWIRSPANHQN